MRCRYASKPCNGRRTTKRGGGLHRFCAYHRARANENQWRVDHRRRLRKLEDAGSRASLRPGATLAPRPVVAPVQTPSNLPVLMPAATPRAVDASPRDASPLTPEDIEILCCLLFSDEDDPA
ncbi:hypothetical protein PINS_up021905 [Pythium insidiosum]|nr:hypothetical protein PINS_up021905 [Pythium insidiosum]